MKVMTYARLKMRAPMFAEFKELHKDLLHKDIMKIRLKQASVIADFMQMSLPYFVSEVLETVTK